MQTSREQLSPPDWFVIVEMDQESNYRACAWYPRCLSLALAVILTVLIGTPAAAATLKLDPTFGTKGVQKLDRALAPTDFSGVSAFSDDGQGLSFYDEDLWRLRPDGAFDTGYGSENSSGGLHNDGYARSIEDMDQFSDGSIAIAGYYQSFSGQGMGEELRPYIAKFTPQGLLDLTFGENGRVIPERGHRYEYKGSVFRAVEVDNKDRIVVGGKSGRNGSLRIDRYFADGRPDESFGGDGSVYFKNPKPGNGTTVQDLKVLQTNKVLVTGSFKGRFFVLRLRANGTVDRSFGKRGWVGGPKFGLRYTCEHGMCGASQLELSPNGSITVSGAAFSSPVDRWASFIARLTAGGQPIKGFGDSGVARLTRKRLARLTPELKAPLYPVGRGSGGIAPLSNGRTFVLVSALAKPGMQHKINRGKLYDAAIGLILDRRGRFHRYQMVKGRYSETFFQWLYFDDNSFYVNVEPLNRKKFFISGWNTSPEKLDRHPLRSVPSISKMTQG